MSIEVSLFSLNCCAFCICQFPTHFNSTSFKTVTKKTISQAIRKKNNWDLLISFIRIPRFFILLVTELRMMPFISHLFASDKLFKAFHYIYQFYRMMPFICYICLSSDNLIKAFHNIYHCHRMMLFICLVCPVIT